MLQNQACPIKGLAPLAKRFDGDQIDTKYHVSCALLVAPLASINMDEDQIQKSASADQPAMQGDKKQPRSLGI